MTSRLILVGRVAGAFGVRGEVRIAAFTDDPATLLAYGALKREDGSIGLTLTGGRAVKGALIAWATGVESRDEATALRGLGLYIDRAILPDPEEDEFYLADLINLAATSPDGEPLGTVKSVHNFGAGDLLEIDPADGAPSWWAPFTKAGVPEVRVAEGVVVVARPDEA
ncbi:MAG: ribosome maturation factor RimM [Pseudomonadota bacterium]|nr:ribosome maturation factor RimM [Pseudomonadota bacterium]